MAATVEIVVVINELRDSLMPTNQSEEGYCLVEPRMVKEAIEYLSILDGLYR